MPLMALVLVGMIGCSAKREWNRQQRQFYTSFAQQVNQQFVTMENFIGAILADTTSNSAIRQIESQCANTLFGWTVTEVDIVE